MSIKNSIKAAIYLLWSLFLSYSSSFAQNLTLASGETLNINQNSVFTSIVGATNGAGKVNFNGNTTINGALGGNLTALAEVDIASRKSVILGNNSANIKNLYLASSASLNSSAANTLNLTNAAGNYLIALADKAVLSNTNSEGNVINYSGSAAGSLTLTLNGEGDLQTAVKANSNKKNAVYFNNSNADLIINGNSANITGNIIIDGAKSATININGANEKTSQLFGDIINNSQAKLEVNISGKAIALGLFNLGQNADSNIKIDGNSSLFLDVVLGNSNQNISIAKGIFLGSVKGAGTVTLTNNDSIICLTSSTLSASIDAFSDAAVGKVIIVDNQTVTANADIGAAYAVGEVLLSSKSTLDLSANNKSITAGNIFLEKDARIKLGNASVNGNISNSALPNGAGGSGIVVEVAGNNTLNGNVAIGFGTVAVGQNAVLSLDDNQITAAEIIMDQGSVLNVQSGTVDADIVSNGNGLGVVNFTYDGQFNKNIGTALNPLYLVAVGADKTLMLDSSATINALNISIANNAWLSGRSDQLFGNISFQGALSRLNLDGGYINGEINGSLGGNFGTLYINENQAATTAKDLGKNYKLAIVELGAQATLNLDANNNYLGSNWLILNNQATLNIGSQALESNVLAASAGVGVINFKENNILAGNVGLSNMKVSQLNISANKTLENGVYNIYANQIFLNSGAVLNIGSGAVSGAVSGAGEVNLDGANISNLEIGTNNQNISGVNVNASKAVNLTASTIYSNQVRVLENSSLALGNGVNIHGDFSLNQNANLAINDGANFVGAVKSSSNSNANGSLNINARQHVINYEIGDNNNFLNQVNIGQNSSVTIFSQINVRSTNISGTANLANAQGNNINGNLNVANGAVLNLFNHDHSVAGDLNVVNGGIIKLEINKDNAGSITSVGLASINSGALIALTIDPVLLQERAKTGLNYTIISGATGSNIGEISGNNIALLNNLTIPNLKFSTINSNNSLILNVIQREDQPLFGGTDGQRNLYRELINLNNVNGNLLLLKQLLLNSQDRAFALGVLESVNPQIDNSINRLSFENTSDALVITSKRINALRGISSGVGMAKKSAWIQTFGAKIHQGNSAASNGYKANTQGLLFGFDKEVEDDLIIGTSFSYVNSSIDSINREKSTSLDGYQLNVYGAKDFSKYFVNAMVGIAYNKYSSMRKILIFDEEAKAQYNGQTYIGRIEVGSNFRMEDDYILTPLFAITTAKNVTENYQERGAKDLNLNVKNNSTSFFETRLGVNVSKALQLNRKQKIQPTLGLSYGYDFAGSKQKTRATFVGQDAGFNIKSANMPQGSLRFEAGSKIFYMNAFSFDLIYAYDLRNNYHAHSGSLRGKYEF